MSRLVLVSDTHLPRFGRRLPVALMDALAIVRPDLILHLGDHTSALAVAELAAIAPVEAIAGNNDPPELVDRFGLVRVIEVEGTRVGLTHGHLGRGATTPDRALATFARANVGVIAFGHSHVPLIQRRGDILMVNPGSPTDRRRQPLPTFAILEVRAGEMPNANVVALPLPQRIRPHDGSAC